MTIKQVVWFSPLSYPLSGGFKPWSLLSETMANGLMKLERLVEGTLGRFIGFRIFMVYEKTVV